MPYSVSAQARARPGLSKIKAILSTLRLTLIRSPILPPLLCDTRCTPGFVSNMSAWRR